MNIEVTNDDLNTFRLLQTREGEKVRKAVMVVIEVPENFCWEDLGLVALQAALHRISEPKSE